MLSHLEYPDDIKSELESEISDALDSAEQKAEVAITDIEEKLEEYKEIRDGIEEMRCMF